MFQERPVIQCVGGVGVDHQLDARKILAQAAHRLEILSRLDFYLDALIPASEFFLHRGGEVVQRFLDTDRDAASNLLANAADEF